MYERIKARVYDIITPDEKSPVAEQVFVLFIMVLIILNVAAVIVETVDTVAARYQRFFDIFNTVSIVIFTVEYLLRVWTCTVDEKYSSPVTGRIKYIFSPLALIDLLAILPFYAPFVTNVDFRVFRVLRLLTLLKMTRYSGEFRLFGAVLNAKRREILISVILVSMLIIISSTLMYFAEHTAQPGAFGSIPEAMWWAVVTLSTVGYGDVLPHTNTGKVIAGCVSMLGIALFALPAGIIASGFVDEIKKRADEEASALAAAKAKAEAGNVCPHCGREMEE